MNARCFSDAKTLREQVGERFQQSLMGETTADASSRETLSAVAHGGNHGRCFKSAEPPNALPPLGASFSQRDKLREHQGTGFF
ncbi:MAG: hypothetical protein ICV78_22175 [Tolypothrix sp. Co-bin9]|nr:hypothetical protein [Tolypothrix sp. Co-bin9]